MVDALPRRVVQSAVEDLQFGQVGGQKTSIVAFEIDDAAVLDGIVAEFLERSLRTCSEKREFRPTSKKVKLSGPAGAERSGLSPPSPQARKTSRSTRTELQRGPSPERRLFDDVHLFMS